MHKILICALLGLEVSHFWNIKLDTCGITTFVYENDRYVLAGHNDTSFKAHRGPGLSRFLIARITGIFQKGFKVRSFC